MSRKRVAPFATYTYANYDKLTRVTYGNGDYLDYTYDQYGRIVRIEGGKENTNDTETLAEYVYNKKGLVTKFVDGKSGETTEYYYDCFGDVVCTYLVSEDGELLKTLTSGKEKTKINDAEYTIENGTDDNGDSYVKFGDSTITTKTDDFGRKSEVSGEGYTLRYSYKNGSSANSTTNLVGGLSYTRGENSIMTFGYDYKANNNIQRVYENNTQKMLFSYDSLSQISYYADKNTGSFTYYDYDNSGNITQKRVYNLAPIGWYPNSLRESVDYSYENTVWGDLLTKYDGQSISYDAIGNPLTYRDGMEITWQNGRELKSIDKSGNTYNFRYNINGLRTAKKNGTTVVASYYYDDSNNLVGMEKGNATALFYYDSEGGLVSMSVGSSSYLFIKNLQGDVVKIIDENSDVVASYTYDAWGKILAENEDSSIAGLNPFRYRGYVYDTETGLYYLQSRYYDPETGRFINADSPEYTDTHSGTPLSTNMFAYCENNAVSGYDPTGNWTLELHKNLSVNAGFKKGVWASTLFADILFSSSPNYSAPFHSRNNLNTVKQLFNAAVDLKHSAYYNDEYDENRVKITCCASDKKPHFSKDGKTYYIPKNVLYYKEKGNSDNYFSKIGKTHFSVLDYLNGKIKWGDIKNNKNLSKIKKQIENYNLQEYLKQKITGQKSQSQALLGLALHALQDFYAHKIMVYYDEHKKAVQGTNIRSKIIKSYDKKYIGINPISITNFNQKYNLNTKEFEDSDKVFSWRFGAAQGKSKILYNIFYNLNDEQAIKLIRKTKISDITYKFADSHYYGYSKKKHSWYFRLIEVKLIISTYTEGVVQL